ncbi:hypothetical protein COM86_12650 [Priestia megaterium]|uniref:hypothetical protein n=1 Tax=Priestia megaterium TaxID=1404 RepID=UPI000BED4A18|nr:hypothetical protein [Priestia megaterium]MED3972265.1 hypothetical protein [Priestia megaterium]PEB63302.1 hypothetical protein COM86_12650 [Priestia megaterium]
MSKLNDAIGVTNEVSERVNKLFEAVYERATVEERNEMLLELLKFSYQRNHELTGELKYLREKMLNT